MMGAQGPRVSRDLAKLCGSLDEISTTFVFLVEISRHNGKFTDVLWAVLFHNPIQNVVGDATASII